MNPATSSPAPTDATGMQVDDDSSAKNQQKEQYIKVNVGGTIFELEKALLNIKDSLFEQILIHSTLHSNASASGSSLLEGTEVYCMDGVYFVNRDPTIFKIIINYLRNPSSHPFPNDAREILMRYSSTRICSLLTLNWKYTR